MLAALRVSLVVTDVHSYIEDQALGIAVNVAPVLRRRRE